MKICMVGYTFYEQDGRLHRYAATLVRRGHRVDVIGSGESGSPRVGLVDGVWVYRLLPRTFNETTPLSYLLNMLSFFIPATVLLTWLHVKKRYEVIHYHNIPDFGVFCALIPKILGARVILDIHDLVPEFYMRKFRVTEAHPMIRLLKWIERVSARFADHVITVTDLWRDRLITRSVPAEKISVVMNLPLESIFQPLPFLPHRKGEPFIISYHGNIAEQTGVDLLVDALGILKDRIPELRLRIIGGGRDLDRLIERIRMRGVSDRVEMRPSVPVVGLPAVLRGSHLAVDPKRSGVYAGETLSVKAMEALALGIPLIVSATQAACRYFDERYVRFFKPDDVSDLAEAIVDLYMHPERRALLSQNSRLFFAIHGCAEEMDRYLRLIARLRSPGRRDMP